MEDIGMFYYLGCHIPRGADCDDGWKCLKGEYCRCLEICSVEDTMKTLLHFRYNGENCIFFEDVVKASEYLNTIKQYGRN